MIAGTANQKLFVQTRDETVEIELLPFFFILYWELSFADKESDKKANFSMGLFFLTFKTRWHTSRDSFAKCGAKHARMSIIKKVEIHKKRIIIVYKIDCTTFSSRNYFQSVGFSSCFYQYSENVKYR
jgi:hypothetical protein